MAKEKKKKVSLADPSVKLPVDEYGIIDWDQVEIPDLPIKGLSEITDIEPTQEDQRRYEDFMNDLVSR